MGKKAPDQLEREEQPTGVYSLQVSTWDAYFGLKSSAWSGLRLGPQGFHQTHLLACLLSQGAEGCFLKNTPCALPMACSGL